MKLKKVFKNILPYFLEPSKIVSTVNVIVSHMLFSIIVFVLMLNIIIHPVGIIDLFKSKTMYVIANWEIRNSELVNNVTNYCSVFKESKQVECVVSQVGLRFNYTDRNYTRMNISMGNIFKADDIPLNGYVCRDIAVAYDAIFRRLGYVTNFNFPPNHVYNSIYKDDFFCDVNMDKWVCFI